MTPSTRPACALRWWTLYRAARVVRRTAGAVDDPLQMADPKPPSPPTRAARVASNSRLPGRFRDVRRASPTIQSSGPARSSPGATTNSWSGERDDPGRRIVSESGFGLRDHSWGPRSWQAPWYYRWLTGNVGPDFGFMGSRIARRDRDRLRGGFVWEGDSLHVCDDFPITSTWEGDDRYHRTVTPSSSGPRRWRVQGSVLRLIPLRNRRATPDGNPRHPHIRGPDQVDDGGRAHGLRDLGVPGPDHRRPARGFRSSSGASWTRPRCSVYEERGAAWAALRRPVRRDEARAFAARVATGAGRVDLGCGAGRLLGGIGGPTVGMEEAWPCWRNAAWPPRVLRW